MIKLLTPSSTIHPLNLFEPVFKSAWCPKFIAETRVSDTGIWSSVLNSTTRNQQRHSLGPPVDDWVIDDLEAGREVEWWSDCAGVAAQSLPPDLLWHARNSVQAVLPQFGVSALPQAHWRRRRLWGFSHEYCAVQWVALKDCINVDTTVQEKNITYPTKNKREIKIIDLLNKITQSHGTLQRRTFGNMNIAPTASG